MYVFMYGCQYMTLYDMMYYMMISKENTECLVSLYIYIYSTIFVLQRYH